MFRAQAEIPLYASPIHNPSNLILLPPLPPTKWACTSLSTQHQQRSSTEERWYGSGASAHEFLWSFCEQDSNRPKSEPLRLAEYGVLLKATRAQNVKPRADENKLFTCRTVWFDAVGGKPAGMQDDEAIRGAQAWYRERKHVETICQIPAGQPRFLTVTVPSVHLVQKQQPRTSHDMDTSSQGHAFPSTSGHISPVSDLAQLPHAPAPSSSAQSSVPTLDAEQ
ncbi:hypothetical protein BU17DRAFT_86634 [Hysterangium stoloniferum]|nr:hypothetical protein BU17DRAFT_86634 [Hysterangium stoloniferum]